MSAAAYTGYNYTIMLYKMIIEDTIYIPTQVKTTLHVLMALCLCTGFQIGKHLI